MRRAMEHRGAVTMMAIACLGALLWTTLVFSAGIGMFAAHRRAGAAADLAALAGALGRNCFDAARVAHSNGAIVTSCVLTGGEVTVQVSVAGPTLFGHTAHLQARARAG